MLGCEGSKVRVCGKKSLKINDGRSGTLSSYAKDSTLYFYKKVFYIYTFPKYLLANVRYRIHIIYECFIEHVWLKHAI